MVASLLESRIGKKTSRVDSETTNANDKKVEVYFLLNAVRTSGEIYARQHPDGPLSHLCVLQARKVGLIFRTLHGIAPIAGNQMSF